LLLLSLVYNTDLLESTPPTGGLCQLVVGVLWSLNGQLVAAQSLTYKYFTPLSGQWLTTHVKYTDVFVKISFKGTTSISYVFTFIYTI